MESKSSAEHSLLHRREKTEGDREGKKNEKNMQSRKESIK
jgi:hypothetical protein